MEESIIILLDPQRSEGQSLERKAMNHLHQLYINPVRAQMKKARADQRALPGRLPSWIEGQRPGVNKFI